MVNDRSRHSTRVKLVVSIVHGLTSYAAVKYMHVRGNASVICKHIRNCVPDGATRLADARYGQDPTNTILKGGTERDIGSQRKCSERIRDS